MEEQIRTETRNMANIFIGLMIVRIYEYFLLKNQTIPTLSFLSYGIGVLFIFLFNRKHCWSLSDFGIRGSINSTWYEVILPVLIWVGAAAAIILPEYLYCTFATTPERPYFDFVCFNQHVSFILSKSDYTILTAWTIIGALICILRAIFLEIYFRGLCFGVLRKKTNFYTCNIVSSLLYALWYMIVPVRALLFSPADKLKVAGMIIIFFIAQFLFAFRQGYVRLVCNTVWPCVITTFIYNFFTFNFMITGIGGTEFKAVGDYIRWAVINLIATLLTFLYCKMMKKKFPPPQPSPEEEKLLREQYDDNFGEEYEISAEDNKE